MDKWSNNRLTVVGPKAHVQRFLKSNWDQRLQARHRELWENSPGRFVCLFETDEPPLKSPRGLSRSFPRLIFLVDHEREAERIKGLAKIQDGEVQHFEISY